MYNDPSYHGPFQRDYVDKKSLRQTKRFFDIREWNPFSDFEMKHYGWCKKYIGNCLYFKVVYFLYHVRFLCDGTKFFANIVFKKAHLIHRLFYLRNTSYVSLINFCGTKWIKVTENIYIQGISVSIKCFISRSTNLWKAVCIHEYWWDYGSSGE